VRVAYDGSPAVVKGKTRSRNLGGSSCAGCGGWEAMVWHGVDDGKGATVAALCLIPEAINMRNSCSTVCRWRL
jgi:hypothetical protein